MSEEMNTCGTCRHYRKNEKAINEGQCVQGPPQAVAIPKVVLGQIAAQVQFHYPTLPPSYPSCNQFDLLSEPKPDD